MLAPLLTIATLFAAAPAAVRASACVAFDINWNLLAFGLDGKDWDASTQDQWGSGTASDITATGRPPFDGTNTTCYLSQFYNAIYFLNADKSNPSDVYIYDATAKSWSAQTTTAGSFDFTNFQAVLDHDTNVIYAVSKGELFDLDMSSLTAATGSALSWNDVEATPYGSDYAPVMALAQNHIHFIDVSGVSAGSADIFVIHFSYFQPEAQSYPASSGDSFPATHGKATSLFQASGVQQEFVFIPDDGSATYVINVETNSTQVLAGPSTKDASAFYFGGLSSIVQLDSTGAVSYLPYNQNDTTANAAAAWTKVSAIESAAPPSSSSASASGSASATGSKSGSSTGTISGATSSSTSSGSTSAAVAVGASRAVVGAVAGAVMMGFAALLL
ncbi:uncharacterized protein STEHIDRAFT_141989 [Stereum hirsutum FP-91666 SS1]|uniref:uncharacterized protein n=1 Tax=Stereum hirsutum (strain FP-91666) TaxID=721885 RepID=UPI000444A044|nr:uncharacterized protein STEHIDRAFT_141989 [Stereum hirsutum FP-91666 SS1]EIM82085.1 hypothetical protein STEHIDRAFT_141989 [Stereum hirsutum FP-91666 SS1]